MRNIFMQIKGFTLVEILVAMFILGIVMTTVYTSFNTVVGKTHAIEDGSEIFNMAQNCLTRMSDDLRSIYVARTPQYNKPEITEDLDTFQVLCEQTYQDASTFYKLKFSSLGHIPFSSSVRSGGISEIIYFVEQSDFGDYVLMRYDKLYPHDPFEGNTKEPVVCDRLKSLKYTFYDEEGEEYETWNSESDEFGYATPSSVNIRLELGDSENTYIFSTHVKLPVCRKKS